MTIWDDADAALAADPNCGAAAEYQPAAGGAWVACQMVQWAPNDEIAGLAPARAISRRVLLPAAGLGITPARGDRVRWGSPATTYVLESADRDAQSSSWLLALRPA